MSSAPDSDFIALRAALAGEYSLDRELGRGGIRSLDAARRVGEQIGEAVAAQDEVERFLREAPVPRTITASANDEIDQNDDADTPIDGVTVARG